MKPLLTLILTVGLTTTLLYGLQKHLTHDRYDRELLNQCTLNGFYELKTNVLRCELIQWREL